MVPDEFMKEICPRGNNKVVLYISLYHDNCFLFMLEMKKEDGVDSEVYGVCVDSSN